MSRSDGDFVWRNEKETVTPAHETVFTLQEIMGQRDQVIGCGPHHFILVQAMIKSEESQRLPTTYS